MGISDGPVGFGAMSLTATGNAEPNEGRRPEWKPSLPAIDSFELRSFSGLRPLRRPDGAASAFAAAAACSNAACCARLRSFDEDRKAISVPPRALNSADCRP